MEVKRVPSTSLSQAQAMQLLIENAVSKFPQVAFVFSRTGTPDLAADPMPPSSSDTYIIVKPQDEWPDPSLSKDDLIKQIETEATKLPGNKVGFSQPIEMRFNELIAGVREDLAVKVFGDDFAEMQRTASSIAEVLRGVDGAQSGKVEETDGLQCLEIKIDKAEIEWRGLSGSAGFDRDRDRRTQRRSRVRGRPTIPDRIRLSDALRNDIAALENLPVPLPHQKLNAAVAPSRAGHFLLRADRGRQPDQPRMERAWWRPPNRGRDIGSLVAAQAKVNGRSLAPGVFDQGA